MKKYDLYWNFEMPSFDDAGGDTGGDAGGDTGDNTGGDAGGDAGGDTGGGDTTFTQKQVNDMMAKEKRKFQEQNQALVKELEAFKSKTKLSAEERAELEARIEQLKDQTLTTEQLAKKSAKKLRDDYENQIKGLTEDRDTWKTRYTESSIAQAIRSAATEAGAYRANQILSILRPQTQLSEVLVDGEPTGELEPRIKFHDKNEEGKDVVLDLTPIEAIKRMKEMDDFANLFVVDGRPGFGQDKGGGGGEDVDMAKLAKENPAKYRKLRREGKLKLA